MKTIYKYDLPNVTNTKFILSLPKGAKFLCVQTQRDKPKMWFIINPDKPVEQVVFRVIGTGIDIEDNFNDEYLGTFQEGPFVWHLFKCK